MTLEQARTLFKWTLVIGWSATCVRLMWFLAVGR